MLISIYIALILLAFVFLGLGLYNGAYGSKLAVESKSGQGIVYHSKLIITISFLLIAALCFMAAALNSLAVTVDHCENQITQTVVSGNTTTYTNQISCETVRHPNEMLGALWGGLFIFTVAMLFVYVFKGE